MDLTFVSTTGQVMVIRVIGRELYFSTLVKGVPTMSTIDGLRLNPSGIVKQFPDLAGKPLGVVREEGIKRFKEYVKGITNDDDLVNYLKTDLGEHGWKMIMVQKQGFRPKPVR